MVTVITRFNSVHQCAEFVTADGHGFTLHADKAYHFPTFEAARLRLIHFPNAGITDVRP